MKTVLAVDGNSVINRAYFGVRPLTNGKGQRTEAIYGMLNMILAQVERIHPDSVQVAFDLHAPTFRHRMYEGYKGNRKGMEEELYSQMEPAKNLLRAFGYGVLSLEGYEADDILGTIARKVEEAGDRCCILTGDRDSLQLISDAVSVLLISKGETVSYDRNKFFEKYGIFPEQFVDAKALMGDQSDCIPGVPGVGEKTALPLIAQFGSLDGVYAQIDSPAIRESVRNKLKNSKDSAYLSRDLSKICREVPLDTEFCLPKRSPELYGLLAELEFTSVIARLNLTKQDAQVSRNAERTYKKATAERLCALREPAAVMFKDGGLYVSAGEEDFFAENFDISAPPLFFTPDRKICVYDSKNFLHMLSKHGVGDFTVQDDPMLAAYVLSSGTGDYALETLAQNYLDGPVEREPCARTVLELSKVLEKRLSDEGAQRLYREIELPMAAVLARCEEKGFLLDTEGLAAFGEMLVKCEKAAEESIFALAGQAFNINSPKQLSQVLYDGLGLTFPGMKKTKNGYSTNAETLEKLKNRHPIVEAILEYRQLSKLRSTYTEGLLKVAGPDGRVHTQFTQTVTATGRLSSVEPNLQNIPVRTELGRELRRFFVAPQGRVLIDADYSQIELRLLAHIAQDETMIAAFQDGVDIHAVTASQVFRVPLDAVTSEMRKRAKAVNFGIVYGISAFSLADDIKVSRKQAEEYIKGYFRTYPGIEDYMQREVHKAKEDGFVTTMWGRRRYVPELTSGKGALKKFGERVAMNSPIQGSAADIIKIAMVRVDAALRKAELDAALILQVHDELIVESSAKDAAKAAEILRREMEGAAQLSVPLTVDLHMGKTWYECK